MPGLMNSFEHKILAVDDNSINIKLLSRTLTNNNFGVLTASSGKEAIKVVDSDKPDLILLDVLMPEMDGYETCKVLKDNPDTSHIPVIFLSAKNETIDKAKGFALGACDYLTKPFDPIEIVARIRSHISIRKDVIELSHKYEDLKLKFKQNKQAKDDGLELCDDFQYLDKSKNISYREVNKSFKINSRIKFSNPPVTTVFIPAYLDNQNFIYLIGGGFEKDYKTAMVQLLLEQYVKGFFSGSKDQSFHEKELYQIFNLVLEKFSPDVYGAPFTISFGYANSNKSEFTNFLIHQSPPLILNNKNEIVHLDPLPILYDSRYAKIIKATKVKLPPKATIVNYVAGRYLREDGVLEELIENFNSTIIGKNVSLIENNFANLPDKDADQLIMSISLL